MTQLTNFDNYNLFYDLDTGKEMIGRPDHFSGWYKFVNRKMTGLLVSNDSIIFLYDQDRFDLSDFVANHKRVFIFGLKKFTLESKNTNIGFHYFIPFWKYNSAPFDYIPSEDLDWGEFLSNIINDKSRQKRIVDHFFNKGQ